MNEFLKLFGGAGLLTVVLFLLSLVPLKKTALGPIENIHGIPYPAGQNNSVIITEPLAHADVRLGTPVVGKQLELAVTYTPQNISSLSVGVREDSFWLSYGSRQEFYRDSAPGVRQARVMLPLTDKLQEKDQSIDLMFFAEAPEGQPPLWELQSLEVKTMLDLPSYPELRNYVGSILKRERAL